MYGYINTLGRFLGPRDVPALTRESLKAAYGFEQADVMVLFGGSIIAGGDVFAEAIKQGAARKYIIVGGAGHTTQTLRDVVHAIYPYIDTDGKPEAEIFDAYISRVYGLHADALETASTNCGNNITNLLELLEKENIPCESIILCQDATMQRRMAATLRKYRPDMTVINYAAYRAEIGEDMRFCDDIRGMWSPERYINLLMGEIPRLTDDENGYGPNGKNFIAHEDIPEEVTTAFRELKKQFDVRQANPLFA